MKKAFTMIELILVIVVAGILAAEMIPRFDRDNLQEAADQVVSNLRYTKHLAMVDDKFDANKTNWFKGRWQIFFAKTNGSDQHWAYTVFSDYAGNHTGTPDVSEIAKNPLDSANKYLTGGYSAGTIAYYKNANSNNGIDSRVTKKMNLGHEYGIKKILFSGCGGNYGRIAFDHIGRPLIGNSRYLTDQYSGSGAPSGSHLLTKRCIIKLCTVSNHCNTASNEEQISIAIEPETGYIHIL